MGEVITPWKEGESHQSKKAFTCTQSNHGISIQHSCTERSLHRQGRQNSFHSISFRIFIPGLQISKGQKITQQNCADIVNHQHSIHKSQTITQRIDSSPKHGSQMKDQLKVRKNIPLPLLHPQLLCPAMLCYRHGLSLSMRLIYLTSPVTVSRLLTYSYLSSRRRQVL